MSAIDVIIFRTSAKIILIHAEIITYVSNKPPKKVRHFFGAVRNNWETYYENLKRFFVDILHRHIHNYVFIF